MKFSIILILVFLFCSCTQKSGKNATDCDPFIIDYQDNKVKVNEISVNDYMNTPNFCSADYFEIDTLYENFKFGDTLILKTVLSGNLAFNDVFSNNLNQETDTIYECPGLLKGTNYYTVIQRSKDYENIFFVNKTSGQIAFYDYNITVYFSLSRQYAFTFNYDEFNTNFKIWKIDSLSIREYDSFKLSNCVIREPPEWITDNYLKFQSLPGNYYKIPYKCIQRKFGTIRIN